MPSILEYLCSQFDGLIVDAKVIRQHVWKDKIAQLFANNVSDPPAPLWPLL